MALPVKHPGDDALGGDLFAEFILLAALGGLAAVFLFAEAAFITAEATRTAAFMCSLVESICLHVDLNTHVT